MTTIRTLALFFLAPLAARAAESTQCDHAALARAEGAVLEAEARWTAARDWGAQNRALALAEAAREQLRTARALCTTTEDRTLVEARAAADVAASAAPFETSSDPFAPAVTAVDVADPEWCAVMGCETSVDDAKAERW